MLRESRPASCRAFRLLLRLFPREFRGDFGEQMIEDFREQHAVARRRHERLSTARLWMRTAIGIIRQAPREHAELFHRDVRFAIRLLLRSPGFTAVAVLTLAFGIGTNTAIFGLADGMLFRPLPFRDPERLMLVQSFSAQKGQTYNRFNRTDFEQLQVVAALNPAEATNPRAGVWTPVARLKPGISIRQAQSEAEVLVRRAEVQFRQTSQDRSVRITNLQFALFELSRPLLWLLVAAAGCVLLLACVNLATLLTARGAMRELEIGIRMAIGAGRGRIVKQLVVGSSRGLAR